jgi:hypothetical protein
MRREQKLHVLTNNAGINMDTGAPVEQKKETALVSALKDPWMSSGNTY